ncbi:MAG: hypothetical protein ACK56I_16005, partial [bacterium]
MMPEAPYATGPPQAARCLSTPTRHTTSTLLLPRVAGLAAHVGVVRLAESRTPPLLPLPSQPRPLQP